MILDRFTKQPRERYVKAVDYTQRLASSGDTIQQVTVETALIDGDADDSASPFEVLNTNVFGSNLKVRYTAEGGADGNTYKATFLVETSTQKFEDEIIFRIREV